MMNIIEMTEILYWEKQISVLTIPILTTQMTHAIHIIQLIVSGIQNCCFTIWKDAFLNAAFQTSHTMNLKIFRMKNKIDINGNLNFYFYLVRDRVRAREKEGVKAGKKKRRKNDQNKHFQWNTVVKARSFVITFIFWKISRAIFGRNGMTFIEILVVFIVFSQASTVGIY